METFVLLKAFDSAVTAKEFKDLFELMGVTAAVDGVQLLVAERHLKKARELAEDYFRE